MEKHSIEELMIDYIDGRLSGELSAVVQEYINSSAAHQKEFEELKMSMAILQNDVELEPESTLRLEFEKALHDQIQNQSGSKVRHMAGFRPVQIAASVALLITGALAGMWLMKNNNKNDEIAAMRQEVEATRQLVIQSLANNSSASTRLRGVNASFEMSQVDADIVNALINTMNNDENTNVRLAAVQALANFAGEPPVRKALIEALHTQTDPVVQIALINMMVQLREKEAVKGLKQIITDEETMDAVKDEAHMAVFKLS